MYFVQYLLLTFFSGRFVSTKPIFFDNLIKLKKSKIIDYSHQILLSTSDKINCLLSIFIATMDNQFYRLNALRDLTRLYPCLAHPVFAKQFPYSYSEFGYFKRVNGRISKGITIMKHFSKENDVQWHAV